MRKLLIALTLIALLLPAATPISVAVSEKPAFKLGNEVLIERYMQLIEHKRVGLVTNPSGVDSRGESTIDILAQHPDVDLVALFGPEHGVDGKAAAGAYVESYTHPTLNIPVNSLYGATRRPSAAMMQGIDIILFDIQDIGGRSYTFISTMYYIMEAAKTHGIPVVILDRPNPVGGEICEGPILEDFTIGFIGIDNLPIAHGMTVGELARFFNRKIGADLHVVPMEGYTRDMVWQDTGLTWVPTSPMVPYVESAFGYNATGLGDGTGIGQQDYFRWIGGAGIDSAKFADLMNSSKLPGVVFIPEERGTRGGVRLQITDFHSFNPVRVNLHALAYGKQLTNFSVPKSGTTYNSLSMFAKVMGGNRVGQWLEQKLPPQQIEARYAAELAKFKQDRQPYLIYGYFGGKGPSLLVDNTPIFSDVEPYIDRNNRAMVPYRVIGQAIGAKVQWNGQQSSVTLQRGANTVVLRIGEKTVHLNGEAIAMDTVPVIQGNRTMVPVRFVGELLDAFVHWDQPSATVIVRTQR